VKALPALTPQLQHQILETLSALCHYLFVLVWIEPSPLGRQLEQACYKDTVLSWADSDSVLVQLVDLKNIPLVNGFTPRAPLLALLTSLEQMQPKSV